LLFVSTLSAWMFESLSPTPVRAERVRPSWVREEAIQLGVELVDLEQLKQIIDTGSHLILDARSQEEYDQGHIPTAMPVSVKEFEQSFPMIAPILEPDSPLVVYCGGPLCDDALLLVKRLRDAGYTNASLFLEGMEGWE